MSLLFVKAGQMMHTGCVARAASCEFAAYVGGVGYTCGAPYDFCAGDVL